MKMWRSVSEAEEMPGSMWVNCGWRLYIHSRNVVKDLRGQHVLLLSLWLLMLSGTKART